MAPMTRLGAAQLAAALRAVADVVEEHAVALDRLDGDHEPDEPDEVADIADIADVTDIATGGDGAAPAAHDGAGRSGADHGPGEGTPPAGSAGIGTRLASLFDGLADSVAAEVTFAGLSAAARVEPSPLATEAEQEFAAVLSALVGSLANADAVDAQRFAIGLELGAEAITADDDGAHAGCLPAVVAVAADGALAALDSGGELTEVIVAAADDGLAELEAGPAANPSLQARGVVDAAAAGFLLVLDTLAAVVTGDPLPSAPTVVAAQPAGSQRYEVRCRVEPSDGCGVEEAAWLESTWHELADRVELTVTGASWSARVLTASPGAVVEAIHQVGRPRDLHIGVVGATAVGAGGSGPTGTVGA